MFNSESPSAPLADTVAEYHASLAVTVGCSAIGVGGLIANAIAPGSTALDGLLLVGAFYAVLATATWLAEFRTTVKS